MYLILTLWGKYHFYFNFTDDETEQRKIKPLAWGPTSGVWWRQRAIQLQSLCPSPKGSAAPLLLSLGPARHWQVSWWRCHLAHLLHPKPLPPPSADPAFSQRGRSQRLGGEVSSIYRSHCHQCVGWMRDRTDWRYGDCVHGLSDNEGSWSREGEVVSKAGVQDVGYGVWLSLGVKQRDQAKRFAFGAS